MRIFGIQPDGNFVEYGQESFHAGHTEETLHDWLESNPEGILEDNELLIIGREVLTDLGGYIDLLGVDPAGNVVVVELKRGRTPRDTVAQALEYSAFVERLDVDQLETISRTYMDDESLNFAEHHRQHFDLSESDAVAFNKDQRIVIVCQEVAPQISETAKFLNSKGVNVTCVEFAFFQAQDGARLMSQEIVVGEESRRPVQVISKAAPAIDEEKFLASLDENGRAVFSRLLEWSKEKSMSISWGVKGFSSGVFVDSVRVPVCFAYPPNSVYKQSIYTAFGGAGSITSKIAMPDEVISDTKAEALNTGLFKAAGQDVKCLIDRSLTDDEVKSLLNVCDSIASAIKKYGLK
ncbi:MAG: endonuclease NucS [Caldilineaceae bacterium]|nr:endonuclease NucS [Caldilineaceae bacterium]